MTTDGTHLPPGAAAQNCGTHKFTAKVLSERIGEVFSSSSSETVYSINGHPDLLVKEIPISAKNDGAAKALERKMAALTGLLHPGLLRCHQVIVDRRFVYLIVDRYDRTLDVFLAERRRTRTPLAIELVLAILRQIVSALAYLHDTCRENDSGATCKGITHRNLRPSNVVLSADRRIFMLTDFGLCEDDLARASTFVSSRPYLAPEILANNEPCPASDIWALGVLAYELATLRRPNFVRDRRPSDVFVDGWAPDLSAVEDDVLRHALGRIFVVNPEDRPSVQELDRLFWVSKTLERESGFRAVASQTALEQAIARAGLLCERIQTTVVAAIAFADELRGTLGMIDVFRRDIATRAHGPSTVQGSTGQYPDDDATAGSDDSTVSDCSMSPSRAGT